ncbi:MAG: questin oxidase family protein [Akkermansiaceae bacterium]|nr:questin oxidase family protein [Akkermansiaceae bacterium]
MEPARPHSGQAIDGEGFRALLGQKRQYPELVEFFDAELKQLGEDKVLEKYAPVLVPGLVAALTHGIIHLGWALDFGSRRMLVEGTPPFCVSVYFVSLSYSVYVLGASCLEHRCMLTCHATLPPTLDQCTPS